MKRFQESNRIVKIWRYRWYLIIPFQWLWYSYINEFKVGIDKSVDGKVIHTDEYDVIKGKNLWHILIGVTQGKMKWYHTHEEVMESLKHIK